MCPVMLYVSFMANGYQDPDRDQTFRVWKYLHTNGVSSRAGSIGCVGVGRETKDTTDRIHLLPRLPYHATAGVVVAAWECIKLIRHTHMPSQQRLKLLLVGLFYCWVKGSMYSHPFIITQCILQRITH